jgi:hypothetical protein
VHAHELCAGPGKIEAGVKILAEEIERAWREQARVIARSPPTSRIAIASAMRWRGAKSFQLRRFHAAQRLVGQAATQAGPSRWLHKSHFSACTPSPVIITVIAPYGQATMQLLQPMQRADRRTRPMSR